MNTEPETNKADAPAPYTPEARAKQAETAAPTAPSKAMHFSWNVRNTKPVKTPPVKQVPAKPTEQAAPAPEPLPPVPASPKPEEKAEPKKEEAPKAEEPVKTEEPSKTEEPAKTEEAPKATPAAPAEKDEKKKGGWGAIVFDSFLFLAVCGVIGTGAWYIHGELKKYDIPSPMEIAIEEQEELCKRREQLQEAAFQADEQIHMRQKLDSLIRQAEDIRRQLDEKKASIAREHSRVMALQHEIRSEDRAMRKVARGLLPGMRIGNATSTTGKTYPEAIITRIQNNRITLSTRTGPASMPIQQLVKDTLPDMARYAFGLDDMVDMSDFESAGGKKKERKKRKGKLIPPRTEKKAGVKDYEQASGAPVVDTEGHRTTTNTAGDFIPGPPTDETWVPPSGELPL